MSFLRDFSGPVMCRKGHRLDSAGAIYVRPCDGKLLCATCRRERQDRCAKPQYDLRPCETCATSFEPHRAEQRFCSPSCARRRSWPSCHIWPKICAECGQPFIARQPHYICCGPNCTAARKRKRSNASTPRTRHKRSVRRSVSRTTDITPAEEEVMRLLARTCPLCRCRMTDEPRRSNSKELDHIVPLIMFGTHTHGNVRIICRDCNLR